MEMIKIFKTVLVALLVIMLIGCGSDKTETGGKGTSAGGNLKIAYSAQPQTLDPQISLAQATADIMGNVYETLLTVDSKHNIQPMLAESYEQGDDGKTITFHLRKGVHFHNGEEMKADDVVASMNRWKDSIGGRSQFSDAVFEAKDDYTVVLNLPRPLSTALSIMSFQGPSFAAIMPKEIVEKASPTGVKEFIGTGPFKFVEWKHDQYVSLSRFDDYQSRSEKADGLAGKKEALLDEVKFIFTPDASTRVAGIQSGEFDFASSVPVDNVKMLENDSNLAPSINPFGYISVNFNKKKGVFSNENARKAVATALDREKILTGSFKSEKFFTVNHSMMMAQQKEWSSDVGKDLYKQNDPEKAKQLLKEAGYNGKEVKIMVTRDYIDHYNAAIVIQSQLEKTGMKVKLEVYDWPTLLDKTADPNAYDMYVVIDLPIPEPTSNLSLIPDFAGWTNSPEMLELVSKIRGLPSSDEAKAHYGELLKWYYDYVPDIKVGDVKKSIIYAKRFQTINFKTG
ncbi:ABC transporter substrate-binding protein [Bacillus sp. PK3_68]|uniref:ABC transporter substrate-binding protein n=1 Tax=Bacillus sp. PK3_68 TaxID=2027408 RepID=UPI000E748841|nr:ABC transporter substrate-binding protein [Bacillus sp. PK3_68]RJS59351.1 ABC transporter substrate-binding protein [Bacillus sp. PK3_68]